MLSPVAWLLAGGAAVLGAALGPWLARVSLRLAGRDGPPAGGWVLLTAVTSAALLAGAALLGGLRPATLGFAWAGGAAVVLASVDLLVHRLPDRVTYPAVGVVGATFVADALLADSAPALQRALLAGAAAYLVAFGLAFLAPDALGLGDVKLLGLLGLLLGWVGWDVLLAGVFLGLLVGAGVAVALLGTRRAGWRTAVPFGPPLLAGAVLALGLAGMGSLG